MAKPKRPRDPNQLAKLIVDISTGAVQESNPDTGKDPAAIARGRLGGLRGGRTRSKKLSRARENRSPGRPLAPAGRENSASVASQHHVSCLGQVIHRFQAFPGELST